MVVASSSPSPPNAASRSAWTFVGAGILLLLVGALIWFCLRVYRQRNTKQQQIQQQNNGSRSRRRGRNRDYSDACRDDHRVRNLTVDGHLSTKSICAKDDSGLIMVHDPLQAQGGFMLGVRTTPLAKFRIHCCGVVNCTNAGGAEVILPTAAHRPGCVIIVNNKTGTASVTVKSEGIDRISLPGQQQLQVTLSTIFVSDGVDTWTVY